MAPILMEGTAVAGTLASGTSDFMGIVTSMLNTIQGSPILLAALCSGLLFRAVAIVKKLA